MRRNMGQLLNWSLGLFNLALESISSSGNVPPLSRYHWKCIFDEGSILNYCLMVHCTKGQVGNVLPRMAKRVPGTATFGPSLECFDCRGFHIIFVQTGGWSPRERQSRSG